MDTKDIWMSFHEPQAAVHVWTIYILESEWDHIIAELDKVKAIELDLVLHPITLT